MSVLADNSGSGRDVALLFTTRSLRLFAYGFLSVVLVLYLHAAGLSQDKIGLLLTLTLAGDTAISLWLTTNADRIGRRRVLVAGAVLMLFAGVLFSLTRSFMLLLLAATIGVISPSGNEVGPFLATEQSGLSEKADSKQRTHIFAWYNVAGSFATALGALAGGGLAQLLQTRGVAEFASYRAVVAGYAIIGAVLAMLFARLSPAVEPPAERRAAQRPAWFHADLGLKQSRGNVFRLAGLFTIDAFAGGFVVQAFVAYWFHERFGVNPATLGAIFFAANLLAGISALSAAWIAKRIGLLATMVATHIPSNVLLMLVPLMPNLTLAMVMLLVRFSISQMDVPTRQAYTMALVAPEERSAAAGVTGIARTVGASLSPIVAGPLYASAALAGLPFLIAGGLKIVYDLLVWRAFRAVKLKD
ncbi:MAG: MFS transporter [Deltaproteobacteria bacterium]|nr:MFS transporter [Deltaproteobacteria bacterium]